MPNENLPKWQTTTSKYLVNEQWLKLRADTCVTPDGKTIAPWYVLEYPEWVNCLVIDRDDNVILLRHYRQGAGEYIQELISGVVDSRDKNPEAAISRELKEEIGYEGSEIYTTGVAYANASSQNNQVHSFLAMGGTCTANTLKELGADFIIEKIPFKDFVAHIIDPENTSLQQSLHLASIFFAFNFLRRSNLSSEAITRLRSALPS